MIDATRTTCGHGLSGHCPICNGCPSCSTLSAQLARLEDVEGMAKAMCEQYWGDLSTWEEESDGNKDWWKEQVRAVIKFVKEG